MIKNTSKFISELLVTLIVAGVLSVVLFGILMFILGNLDLGDEWKAYMNTLSSIVFGIIVGYKVNSLMREHK